MVRKLLLATATVATFAISATNAPAVSVEYPGMYAITGENTFAIILEPTLFPAKFPIMRCNNDWEANVDADGDIEIHQLDFGDHPNSTTNCLALSDCGGGWNGEFEEPATGNEFEMHIAICIQNLGGELNSVPFLIECSVEDDVGGIHCDQLIHQVVHPVLGFCWIEVEGEVFLDSSPGLMHEAT